VRPPGGRQRGAARAGRRSLRSARQRSNSAERDVGTWRRGRLLGTPGQRSRQSCPATPASGPAWAPPIRLIGVADEGGLGQNDEPCRPRLRSPALHHSSTRLSRSGPAVPVSGWWRAPQCQAGSTCRTPRTQVKLAARPADGDDVPGCPRARRRPSNRLIVGNLYEPVEDLRTRGGVGCPAHPAAI